jgi:hypothetical protein
MAYGLTDTKPIQAALTFRKVPRENWKQGLEQLVLASSFSFPHSMCFGGRISDGKHENVGDDSHSSRLAAM